MFFGVTYKRTFLIHLPRHLCRAIDDNKVISIAAEVERSLPPPIEQTRIKKSDII